MDKSDKQLCALCVSSLAVFKLLFSKAFLTLSVFLKAPYLQASSGLSLRCSVALNMGNTLRCLSISLFQAVVVRLVLPYPLSHPHHELWGKLFHTGHRPS